MKINELDKKELIKLNKWNEQTISLLEKSYPVQYIIGYVDFYGLKINVNEFTLIPRYETEYLIELTIKEIQQMNLTNLNILDLCTGSGAIGLTLKSLLPSSNVTLSDISKDNSTLSFVIDLLLILCFGIFSIIFSILASILESYLSIIKYCEFALNPKI